MEQVARNSNLTALDDAFAGAVLVSLSYRDNVYNACTGLLLTDKFIITCFDNDYIPIQDRPDKILIQALCASFYKECNPPVSLDSKQFYYRTSDKIQYGKDNLNNFSYFVIIRLHDEYALTDHKLYPTCGLDNIDFGYGMPPDGSSGVRTFFNTNDPKSCRVGAIKYLAKENQSQDEQHLNFVSDTDKDGHSPTNRAYTGGFIRPHTMLTKDTKIVSMLTNISGSKLISTRFKSVEKWIKDTLSSPPPPPPPPPPPVQQCPSDLDPITVKATEGGLWTIKASGTATPGKGMQVRARADYNSSKVVDVKDDGTWAVDLDYTPRRGATRHYPVGVKAEQIKGNSLVCNEASTTVWVSPL